MRQALSLSLLEKELFKSKEKGNLNIYMTSLEMQYTYLNMIRNPNIILKLKYFLKNKLSIFISMIKIKEGKVIYVLK